MAENSKIQWTDATWNPWHGCKKVSPGCKYCYMFRDKERYGQEPTNVLKSKSKFIDPLRWQKELDGANFERARDPSSQYSQTAIFDGMKIFTCSWSDWFIEEADEWRDEAWKIIKDTPEFIYQILTKRPERIKDNLPEDWGEGYDNVWIGVSIENQKVAIERLPVLAMIDAKVKFLSIEPIIGPIDLTQITLNFKILNEDFFVLPAFDWVIIGGESGNDTGKYRYRPAELSWFEKIIDDCQMNEIPVFMKQTGTYLAKRHSLSDRHGGNIEDFPETMRIRQFPNNKNN